MLFFYLHIYLPESLVKYRILGWKSSAYWKHCIVVFYYSVFVVEKFKAIVFHCMWLDCSFLEACRIFSVSPVLWCFTKNSLLCVYFHLSLWVPETHVFLFCKIFKNCLLLTFFLHFLHPLFLEFIILMLLLYDWFPNFLKYSSLSWIHYSDVASIWLVP